MRSVFVVAMIVVCATVEAKPYTVVAKPTIFNGDWYPLPPADMRAAVVDTALAEITKSGQLIIVDHAPTGVDSTNDGSISLDIFLLNSEQVVAVTITLQLPGCANYTSTLSLNVRGMDHQELYNAFEFVGRETANRLITKTAVAKTCAPPPNDEVIQIFNRAQELKRLKRYAESRALFAMVVDNSALENSRFRDLADVEVRYGLLVQQAADIAAETILSAAQFDASASSLDHREHLYRQILANNVSDSDVMLRVNTLLEELKKARTRLAQIALDEVKVALSMTIRELAEVFSDHGDFLVEETLRQMFSERQFGAFGLNKYLIKGDQLELALNDMTFGVEFSVVGTRDRENNRVDFKLADDWTAPRALPARSFH